MKGCVAPLIAVVQTGPTLLGLQQATNNVRVAVTDRREEIEGRHSALLTADSTRVWPTVSRLPPLCNWRLIKKADEFMSTKHRATDVSCIKTYFVDTILHTVHLLVGMAGFNQSASIHHTKRSCQRTSLSCDLH